jgi:hypothetical protein
MRIPHLTVTVTANVVAWYAAIMSTIIAMAQAANYLRDRANVRVSFQRNMQIFNDPTYAGMTLTLVCVVNTGRRKLTITTVGAMRSGDQAWIFGDATPPLPCILDEGSQIQVLVNQAGLDFNDIRWFEAYNAAGRRFRKVVAPWYRRVFWFFRRKFS